jgi:hypothetical protein
MPNNKRNEGQRLAKPEQDKTKKRTPSDNADKSGAALGKQSSKRDAGASTQTGSRKR